MPELTIRTPQQDEPVDAAVAVRGGAEMITEAQTGAGADGEAVGQVPPSPNGGCAVTATLTGGGEDQSLTMEDVMVQEVRENRAAPDSRRAVSTCWASPTARRRR